MKDIKAYVKEQYSKVVQGKEEVASCCQGSCPCEEGFNEDYASFEGYLPEADYGLGCGLPTAFAKLKLGQTVLDLGSGAGNDCFVARAEVGPMGRILGLDFSEAMIHQARKNATQGGYDNVEFILGDIEDIPLPDKSVDVVISNCVLNLIPNKTKVFSEIHRVLKKGGHFSISDVVTNRQVPENMNQNLDLLSDCISGAIPEQEYLEEIRRAGFQHIQIQKKRPLALPAGIRKRHELSEGFQILSLTVFGEKA